MNRVDLNNIKNEDVNKIYLLTRHIPVIEEYILAKKGANVVDENLYAKIYQEIENIVADLYNIMDIHPEYNLHMYSQVLEEYGLDGEIAFSKNFDYTYLEKRAILALMVYIHRSHHFSDWAPLVEFFLEDGSMYELLLALKGEVKPQDNFVEEYDLEEDPKYLYEICKYESNGEEIPLNKKKELFCYALVNDERCLVPIERSGLYDFHILLNKPVKNRIELKVLSNDSGKNIIVIYTCNDNAIPLYQCDNYLNFSFREVLYAAIYREDVEGIVINPDSECGTFIDIEEIKKIKDYFENYAIKNKILSWCPCCGEGLIDYGKDNNDICSLCGWQNDEFQYENPDYTGGANKMSLNQTREYYKKHGRYKWGRDF